MPPPRRTCLLVAGALLCGALAAPAGADPVQNMKAILDQSLYEAFQYKQAVEEEERRKQAEAYVIAETYQRQMFEFMENPYERAWCTIVAGSGGETC